MSPTARVNLGDILQDKDHGHHMRFTKGDIRTFFAPGPDHEALVAERRSWLARDTDRYLALEPEGVDSLDETLELAAAFRPPAASGDPLTRCRALGEHWEADFLLMKPDEHGTFRLRGGCLCFPSHWALQDKMNLPMAAIHNPVPGLNRELGRQIDGFLERIKPGISWERANWGLARSPELNLHPSREIPRLDASVPIGEVWWRLEHQSLIALPRSRGILFGIKVSVEPLASIKADPAARRGLIRALRTMPEAMAGYKGLASCRPHLIDLLESE